MFIVLDMNQVINLLKAFIRGVEDSPKTIKNWKRLLNSKCFGTLVARLYAGSWVNPKYPANDKTTHCRS
jgi:hypothetical protein